MKKASIIIFILFTLTGCVGYMDRNNQQTTDYPNRALAHKNAELALFYLKQGYTNLAYEKLQQAEEQAPNDPVVVDSMGYYYEKTGQLDKASQYFYGALLYAPESITAQKNYGAFLCRNGYYQEAIRYFRQINPKIPTITADMAYCMQELQQALGDRARYAYDTQKESSTTP